MQWDLKWNLVYLMQRLKIRRQNEAEKFKENIVQPPLHFNAQKYNCQNLYAFKKSRLKFLLGQLLREEMKKT